MTVLRRYVRLESSGLWRDGPNAQRRDVVVQLGDASLTFLDVRSGVALSHWSLPALARLNPGSLPALYAPGGDDSGETLELAEAEMIDAIETVRGAIGAARPRPWRLRLAILTGSVALLLALGVFWLPRALATHAAAVAPAAARAEIGRLVLADLSRFTDRPCIAPAGQRAARALAERLFGPGGADIVVVRDGIRGAVQLPGRIVVLDARTLGAVDAPELVAGHLLAARLQAEAVDPLIPVLRYAGVAATLRLLTSGKLPRDSVAGYSKGHIALPPHPVGDAALAERAAAAQVDLGPYAAAMGGRAALLDAMEKARVTAPRVVLSDADWISLRAICD
ncbi:MAG: hypothetical protein ACK4TB_10600 [Gemmobacter sp.]